MNKCFSEDKMCLLSFFLSSFCPSDTKFASCSDDGTVRIWDFMRCHEERILRGHGADVRCVDWHPQKALLASGSKDNQQPVKLWDPRTGNSLATLHAHKHTVMDLKWHLNGNWMLTASRDHLLKLFDIRNLKEELQTFKGHKREATAIGWHPIHEGLFVSGSADGALMFWMVGCDHEVGGMEEAHEGMVWSVAWHPLGHILASGSNDHATKFWTRNRPGDEMRDKYNLNTLPMGMMEQELLEYSQESATPNLPGMGLEHGLPEHLQVKEEKPVENELPSIPGLDWEEDSALLKAEEKAAQKKVPYARPVPKMFEQAWSGEIDVDQLKKEQQQQQLKAQFMQPSQSSLLLAQQVIGAAIAGTLRQQLAASEGGRMLLPGGPLMLGAPRMIIAPGQPVMGPRAGQMLLIPGSGGGRSLAPGNAQTNNKPPDLQSNQQLLANTMSIINSNMNSVNPLGPQQVGNSQIVPNQQPGQLNFNQGQIRLPQGAVQMHLRPQMPQGPSPMPQGQVVNQGQLRQQDQGEGLQNNNRPSGPQFSGNQGPFGPSQNLQPNMNIQEMDKDERFQGPVQQMGEENIQEMDQDYRHHIYNGPVGALNAEDEDYRVTGGNMRDTRNMNDPRLQDNKGRHNDGNYQEGGYGDTNEREMDVGDYDHRNISSRNFGPGRGNMQGRGGHAAHDNRGWDNYEEAEYPEESWDGGDNGNYDESYDGYEEGYTDQPDYNNDNRNRKRPWDEGPGAPRGMGPRGGGAWGRGDMRGRGRPNFRNNRGMRPGGYRGPRGGWNRGSERGGRGGHRGY
ncbi:WD repeat-containing protein 33 [Bulinus truncatus]|nr:WD repeat-containing protein 33 [Bulinus truncatus]